MQRFQETRSWGDHPLFVARAAEEEDGIRISGYGSVFGRWYNVYGFKERVAPGAFTKTLQEHPDIRGMFNHDPNFLLGRTKSGTMEVYEDRKGLKYDILADKEDPQAQSVARKIARGDVDGSSMAFFVHDDDWEENKDGSPKTRTITEIELIETGPVTMPASPATTAKIQRALEESGIDYEAINGLVVKSRGGFRLSAADDDLLDRTIAQLERLRSEPETIHSEPSTSLSPEEAQKYSEAAWAMRKRWLAALAA